MKKIPYCILIVSLAFILTNVAFAMSNNTAYDSAEKLDINAKSAILVDYDTGTILYEKNSHERLPPASITKVMTLLLICEAVEKGKIKMTDSVIASQNAVRLGGSQIYLKENEQMSVNDLIKAIAISSANDACVALAEHIAGSVDEFVYMMNNKAKKLNMIDTNFINPYGLDTQGHYSSAYDIAIMSRELLKHEWIRKYLTTWMDTLRDGKFGLVNTNRLVRYYKGITGVKTGSTNLAKFCISASAQRNGLHLIAVVMGAPDSKTRFNEASKLLDWGFARYSMYAPYTKGVTISRVKVRNGVDKDVEAILERDIKLLLKKGDESSVKINVKLEKEYPAPVKKNQILGVVQIIKDNKILGEYNLVAKKDVSRRNILDIFRSLFIFE